MLASFPPVHQAECAIAKLRKDVIHLKENGFQKSDQEKENDDARESRLANQPSKKLDRFDRALPHRLNVPAETRA